jgi:hypothetical protein
VLYLLAEETREFRRVRQAPASCALLVIPTVDAPVMAVVPVMPRDEHARDER